MFFRRVETASTSDPLLLQHMRDCERRQDKIDASQAGLANDLKDLRQDNDNKHTVNVKGLNDLRKSGEAGRSKIVFWLLTTAVGVMTGMVGLIIAMAWIIVQNQGHK